MNLFRKTLVKMGHSLGLKTCGKRPSLFRKVILKSESTLAIQPCRSSLQQVDCHQGVLWITQEGDGQDIILQKGQRATLKGRGKILIHAFTSSTFLMRGMQDGGRPPMGLPV